MCWLTERLKAIVVPARRKDRITVQEREAEALKQKELEQEAKRLAEERRKYTLKVLRGGLRVARGGGRHCSKLSLLLAADRRRGSKEGAGGEQALAGSTGCT